MLECSPGRIAIVEILMGATAVFQSQNAITRVQGTEVCAVAGTKLTASIIPVFKNQVY